jgi:MFS family permease
VRRLLAVHFLVFLAFNFFYIAFPVHAVGALEWSLLEVGLFFSAMGLMMAVAQGPVLAAASKLVGERVLVVVGGLALAGGFALYVCPSVAVIYVATGLVALGNGLMWPSLLAWLSKASAPGTQGAVQGFASSAAAVASISGLILGGVLYHSFTTTVFLVAAIVTMVAILVAAGTPVTKNVSAISPAGLRSSVRRRSPGSR